jgi:hypothetical protein
MGRCFGVTDYMDIYWEGMRQFNKNPCKDIPMPGYHGVDPVNKPDHYTPKEGEIECIAYIEQVLGPEKFIGYCHGNVTKYLHRHTYKGKPVEDLEKAQVYLGWMIKAMKGERVRG